ncbi:MAG: hypothetical protein E6J34_18360 [Chloroflexi bacterium]|jgi:hypothetical protein|nr:MAG: hypothetical protein E6J34_18360 [Chloroflexota bacterium]
MRNSLEDIKRELRSHPNTGHSRRAANIDDDEVDSSSESIILPYGNPPSLSHLLGFFPWVEEAQVKKIVTGKFNINNLPKLLRDADARQKNLEDTVHGIITDIPTGKQKFLIADGKMGTAFPNLQSFLSAFNTYAAIRSAYAPEYGSALTAWMEQLSYHAVYASWSQVLKFAIDFFRKYQTKPPQDWLPFDNHLTSVHFTHSDSTPTPYQPPPSTTITSSKGGSKNSHAKPEKVPIQYQTCINFNKEKGCTFQAQFKRPCGRLHNCWACGKEGHPCRNCPTNPCPFPSEKN